MSISFQRLRHPWSLRLAADAAPAGAFPNEPGAAPPAPARVDSRDRLARMTPAFKRALRAEFDVGGLLNKLCPVELDNGHVALFTVDEYAQSEQIEEFERMVAQRGRILARPARVVVPATLLLSIVRGQITGDALRSRRRVLMDPVKSSMAAAFHDIVAWGVRHAASDIHVNVRIAQPESEIRYTVGGRYVMPERFRGMQTATLMDILAVAYMDIQGGNGAVFDPVVEQQGSILHEVDGTSFMLRWASLATDAGASVTLRLLRMDLQAQPLDFAQLGYLPSQIRAMQRALVAEGGAIVLAGVVGSGKSTTIASMMSSIPPTRKVITLEDPVEYLIPNALQNSVSRSLDGSVSNEFDAKLKTIKRSAMNDLLIGEIRDLSTGRAFMDLASSGSNLYTTTHAGAAALIPDRLASEFIGVSRQLLATPGILKLLVYQTLLPRLCAACALPFDSLYGRAGAAARGPGHWRSYGERLHDLYGLDPTRFRVRNPEGCPACRETALAELRGYAGRTVAAEMIDPAVDDGFLKLVRRADALALRDYYLSRRRSAFDDPDMTGKTAMECAVYKASQGLIDPRDVEPRFVSFETVQMRRRRAGETRRAGLRGRRLASGRVPALAGRQGVRP
ncbi:Toxin coregulated pilus biosynthesis protein T [Pigmentiphaga humi]|uniref:Toxin coregulated pilus biosynthesis protein T n=1 Tax=Pigmentiphaga humi TaxID=2478468 RepID=A0A3P4AYC3_9BURK|nr:ATPase, T2SS/T4P/T4SS family [Pigmentiphaga humi]VCU69074.1 Toxin coregulated pilus biosynthesis protein T [Pigmentiphaga humi]